MFRPRDLRIVMRVHIDEARRDDKTPRIYLFGSPFGNLAEFDNAITNHGDISDDRRTSCSVNNGAAADHYARILTHGRLLLVDGTLSVCSVARIPVVITLVVGVTLCKTGRGGDAMMFHSCMTLFATAMIPMRCTCVRLSDVKRLVGILRVQHGEGV